MKPKHHQLLAFLALFIGTWCQARSYAIDKIGDGELIRDASWGPWATCWYIISAAMQIITFLQWFYINIDNIILKSDEDV